MNVYDLYLQCVNYHIQPDTQIYPRVFSQVWVWFVSPGHHVLTGHTYHYQMYNIYPAYETRTISISIYLSISLYIHMSIYTSIISLYLSFYLFICLYICLSVSLFLCLSVHLFLDNYTCVYILFVYISLSLSVHEFVSLCMCHHIWLTLVVITAE